MKYLILLLLFLPACTSLETADSYATCLHLCGLEHTSIRLLAEGMCLCDEEQGNIATEAYHKALNGGCK